MKGAAGCEKNALSSCGPTGRLDPTPADLAAASLALAALESQVRRGESIFLDEDATRLWRVALPRLGWWRRAQRFRLPLRPLRHGQIKRDEALKRQAGGRYRPWSRLTHRGWRSVVGAVQYGTSGVFDTIVPHFDAHEFRHYIHQRRFSRTETRSQLCKCPRRDERQSPATL